MNKKVKQIYMISLFVVAIIASIAAFFLFPSYYFNKAISSIDLRKYPNTSAFLVGYYDSWKNEAWADMGKYPFGNMNAEFCEDVFSGYKLTDYKIIGAFPDGEDRINYEVMLTVNGVDSLIVVRMFWNPIQERWTIVEQDLEYEPFDYDAYRKYLDATSGTTRIYDTMIVFCVVVIIGLLVFLAMDLTLRMVNKSPRVTSIPQPEPKLHNINGEDGILSIYRDRVEIRRGNELEAGIAINSVTDIFTSYNCISVSYVRDGNTISSVVRITESKMGLAEKIVDTVTRLRAQY